MLYSADDLAFLRGLHIARAWFVAIDLPSGYWRLHGGVGTVTVGGHEWTGVSDPLGRQMVSIGAVEDMRFGQAAKVDIVPSGVNAEFFASVKDTARDIEGRDAWVYWAAFDQETQQVWSSGLKLMVEGYVSSPKLARSGIGQRTVSVAIEGIEQSQNFPFGGRWNDADQQRRYPGDMGLQFVGVDVQEVIKGD